MCAAQPKNRPGYTLMEIMVVVAIFLILAALSIPVIHTMLDDARITSAGDLIRGRAADARARAMETGRPWRLACLPNTGVFQLAPDDAPDWENMDQTPIEKEDLHRDLLPEHVVFGTDVNAIFGSQSQGSAGGAWHTIAVYDYLGAAREDTTTFFGKMGQMPMGIELRALTGSITVKTSSEVVAMQP